MNRIINLIEQKNIPKDVDSLTALRQEWVDDLADCLSNPLLRQRLSIFLIDEVSFPKDVFVDLLEAVLYNYNCCIKEACFALGWIATPRSVAALHKALHSSEAIIRKFALFVLGEIGGEIDAEAVVCMIVDNDSAVREMSAFSIGWNQGDFRVELLERLIVGGNVYDLDVVQLALNMIGTSYAKELIKEMADDRKG